MNIKEILNKNNIPYQKSGSDLIIICPFCEKTIMGDAIATFHIDQSYYRGNCNSCSKIAEWEEISEKLGISIEQKIEPKEEKTKVAKKTQKQDFQKEEIEPVIPAERIKKLDKPEKELSFKDWQEVIKLNFPELLFSAETGLSIISQILIKEITNPFALVLVDVPSAGKTIAVNFFADIRELAYPTDRFTPSSFVSNASNVKKSELKNIDLLPRIQYKLFIIRDLAPLFSKRDDDLNECLGILTRVLDGEGLNTDSGIHGQREYNGEYLFMILAASTPIPPKVWKMMGNLGSRLFFLSLNTKDKSETELASQLKNTAYKDKEKACRQATTDFLKTLWNKYPNGVIWEKEHDQHEEIRIISRCAMLLAKLRGVINVWKDSFGDLGSYDHTMPTIEKPDRINQLFYNLCRGHALVCGRNQINQDDLRFVVELTIDSAPTIRAKLFRKLIEHNGVMTTSEVEEAMNCSKPTALAEMEKLKILKVCHIRQESHGAIGEPEKEIHLIDDFKWFLSEECRQIRNDKTNVVSDLVN